ncbi:hypothetical protein MRB53_009697 [Persea americana]|uniref:Uncharacterized protein n=1 Tax=Persea americana TaxID=3435 RepID=A0ACC2LPQ5_PERAE|nr:hypothetical protein MRB53_009697 [Persea americana]
MGLRKEIAFWFVLLMLVQLKTSCFADGYKRFERLRGGSISDTNPVKSKSLFGGGDGVFDAEKRKVHTEAKLLQWQKPTLRLVSTSPGLFSRMTAMTAVSNRF